MRTLVIYTDGSHLKHTTGRLGIGGILVESGKAIDKFSIEVSTDYLKRNYETSDVSNPTCEMLATLIALRTFGPKFKKGDEIRMKADYLGVKNWNEGSWKIKAPYIQKIKDEIDSEISKQGLSGRIHFEWVKGHPKKSVLDPDAIWNGRVDLLAKGEDYE